MPRKEQAKLVSPDNLRNKYKNKLSLKLILAIGLVFVILSAVSWFLWSSPNNNDYEQLSTPTINSTTNNNAPKSSSPLAGKEFYIHTTRTVNKAITDIAQNDPSKAKLLEKITNQPTAIWLNGPTTEDPNGNSDLYLVEQISQSALQQNKVALYQIYAIPHRDACAGYSSGGFKSSESYLNWVANISSKIKSETVVTLEPDALAHTIESNCLTNKQTNERYATLASAITTLKQNPKVIGVYLDSGHSEWFPDASKLVEPLKRAGIDNASGITVNVSNFIATPDITKWAQDLVALIGKEKGILIDTSRNGRGSAPNTVTGEARWCNPEGRGLGKAPTTNVNDKNLHAYVWIKVPGESDGSCRGNPDAGVFITEKALELASNAE